MADTTDTTDTIDPAVAGTISELGDAIFAATGGHGDFSSVNPARLAKITPERREKFISLRAAQSDAKATQQAELEIDRALVETRKTKDRLIAECAQHYPPQSRIDALREVQAATRRRSR